MKKLLPLTSLLYLLFCLPVISQVTIGSEKEPVIGSLLDLKEQTPDINNVTSIKGLGMPRVKLTHLTIPSGETSLSKTIDGTAATDNWSAVNHIGLVVYNINEDQCAENPLYKGLYVWDGDTWQPLSDNGTSSSEVFEYTDSRDGEVYLYRSFGTTAGEWMLENLRYDANLHTDPAYSGYTHSVINSTANPYFCYPEGNESPYISANHPSTDWEKKKKNGLLYNWISATNSQNNSTIDQGQGQAGEGPAVNIQGICPPTWHLPSDKEWNDLEREIANSPEKYSFYAGSSDLSSSWSSAWETNSSFRGAVPEGHGKAMKSMCPVIGGSLNPNGYSFLAKRGGFDALIVGWAWANMTVDYGTFSAFWSSSASGPTSAWQRSIVDSSPQIGRDPSMRYTFLSVRCKKD